MKFKYFLIFILFPLSVSADTVEIDGIWYNLIAKAQSAEVVANPNRYYVESVKIPEEVEYNGNKYIVNTIGTYAFDWSSVKEVTIPSSIKSMKSVVMELQYISQPQYHMHMVQSHHHFLINSLL